MPRVYSIPGIKIEDWKVDDVITWMDSLNLSQRYRRFTHFYHFTSLFFISYEKEIKENHISGRALLTMKTKDDWKELGVSRLGDLRILVHTPVTSDHLPLDSSSSTSSASLASKGNELE